MVMVLQNATSQDNVKLNLEDHESVLLTICVTSLILGVPLAINTLDQLKVGTKFNLLYDNTFKFIIILA